MRPQPLAVRAVQVDEHRQMGVAVFGSDGIVGEPLLA